MRYVYLGDALTDPLLVNRPCTPVIGANGHAVATPKRTLQLVRFEDGSEHVVLGRRLISAPELTGGLR